MTPRNARLRLIFIDFASKIFLKSYNLKHNHLTSLNKKRKFLNTLYKLKAQNAPNSIENIDSLDERRIFVKAIKSTISIELHASQTLEEALHTCSGSMEDEPNLTTFLYNNSLVPKKLTTDILAKSFEELNNNMASIFKITNSSSNLNLLAGKFFKFLGYANTNL